MEVYSLLLLGFLVIQLTPAHSKVYSFSTKAQGIPSFAASCNFLCYSGVLSRQDGCACHLNLCRPGRCRSGERCQTKLMKGNAVATCCPKSKHHACSNQPRFHARRGRQLFYFRRETQSCHRFIPTRYDSSAYFRSYFHCIRSCTCRLVSRNK